MSFTRVNSRLSPVINQTKLSSNSIIHPANLTILKATLFQNNKLNVKQSKRFGFRLNFKPKIKDQIILVVVKYDIIWTL